MVDGAASGDWGIRRREPLEDNRVVLSEQEQHTYLHLGIIAANAGYGGAIYRWRQGLSGIGSGDYFVETGDLAGWAALQGYHDGELKELYDFGNSLFHGVATVRPDGALEVFDNQKDHRVYSFDEVRQYASRFFSLRIENRIAVTFSCSVTCPCGASFPVPEREEEWRERTETCRIRAET